MEANRHPWELASKHLTGKVDDMSRLTPRMGWTISLVIALTMTGGCKNKGLVAERDALFVQAQQLQDELNRCRAAMDACTADSQRLSADLNNLQIELQNERAKKVTQGRTGFEGITGTEVIRSRGSITVRVPGDVLFASGKISLRSSAKSTLDQIAGVVNGQYAGKVVRVVGHTDTDPIKKSKWKDNLQLSMERAAAVHRYLQSRGMRPQLLEAVGVGQWHPRSSKSKSRRVEIVVVTDQ